MYIKIDQNGKQELIKDLDKFIKQIANEVVKEAQAIVPVDTGQLRDSITTREIDIGQYEVGSDLEYAIYVELGTRNMQASPFLRPAINNVKNKTK